MTWKRTFGGYEATLATTGGKSLILLPTNKVIDIAKFTEIRGSGADILYWQYAAVGPGKRTTTFIIWNIK